MYEERPTFTRREDRVSLVHVDVEPKVDDEELEGYIEHVEKAAEDHKSQVPRDDQGQPLIQVTDDFQMPDDAVVLPVTQEEFEMGMQASIASSARWLAWWCLYMIKKYGEKVFFRG